MKNKIFLAAVMLSLSFNTVNSQELESVNTKVDREYNNLNYKKSIRELSKLVKSGNKSPEVLAKLATAYYLNAEMGEAARHYSALFSQNKPVDHENYYRYAMALKATSNYEEANKYLNKFAVLKPADSRSKKYLASPNYLAVINKLSSNYDITNLESNTPRSDFGTAFYNKGIVYASSRGGGKHYKWNDQPFLDLYYLEEGASNPRPFSKNINTKYHESSASFSLDGNTMYFTRNNYYRGKKRKSEDEVIGLKIYSATKNGLGAWGNIQPMPFNNDNYNVSHPALSMDNKKLYFASDMPGTLGKSDIYVVSILEDGIYGVPTNLGSTINTEGRENFPYISNNGTLYFASDGHQGLGGLDVFSANIKDGIKAPKNMGMVINSAQDDFGFIVDEFTKEGFFTSNRENGKGDDDIYRFQKGKCEQLIAGVVVNKTTQKIIPEATVVIYDADKKEVNRFTSDKDGAFSYKSNCENESFRAVANKDKFEEGAEDFEISINEKANVNLVLNLVPEPVVVKEVEKVVVVKEEVAKVGTDLFKLLNLNPIYFDYDKSFIRGDAQLELQKVINYLNEYPSVSIDVQSHTDSRGRDQYNYSLSDRRNKATKGWIETVGRIDRSRLTGRGYGESRLVNRCSNGVKCSKYEHQQNRRSMFIVTKN